MQTHSYLSPHIKLLPPYIQAPGTTIVFTQEGHHPLIIIIHHHDLLLSKCDLTQNTLSLFSKGGTKSPLFYLEIFTRQSGDKKSPLLGVGI
jgi:hypothetical protein